MAIVAGSTVERDASGIVEEFLNGTFTNCTHRKCSYGLQNSFQASNYFYKKMFSKQTVRRLH